jgi:GntR family transcriptional repressor for pyruvate dehydrogenase complex
MTPVRLDQPGTPLATSTAADSAASFLRSLIFSRTLVPGDRLPSERNLAAHLGISRITLRLALKSLESAGYIVTTRGAHGGSRVVDAAALQRCWDDWLLRHRDDLEDIFEYRRTIELRIAALAAERRTPNDLDALRAALHPSAGAGRDMVHWHTCFHDALGRAAHSSRLEQALAQVRGEIFVPAEQVVLEERVDEIYALHADVFEAVLNRDPARARACMESHLDYTTAILFGDTRGG